MGGNAACNPETIHDFQHSIPMVPSTPFGPKQPALPHSSEISINENDRAGERRKQKKIQERQTIAHSNAGKSAFSSRDAVSDNLKSYVGQRLHQTKSYI